MGILTRAREAYRALAAVPGLRAGYERLAESVTDVARARKADEAGWLPIGGTQSPIQPHVIRERSDSVEAATILNPLMRRGHTVRAAYVHGQGVTITARAPEVNQVIQAFLDDESNASIVGMAADVHRELRLFTRGEYALALFTNPLTGRVQGREIPTREIVDIITAPGDAATRHYYIREWDEASLDEKGTRRVVQRKAAYPDVKYQPTVRPATVAGCEILWDAPIVHLVANPIGDGLRGVGDGYAALDWAAMHRTFLEDYARLAQALSKLAWKMKGVSRPIQERLAHQAAQLDTLPAGSAFTGTEGTGVEAVSKSGALIDPDGGRALAAMVASAIGLPVTVLLSDPGVTGARATAETLDRPLVLEMRARQELHRGFWLAVMSWVVEAAATAPEGPLQTHSPRFTHADDRISMEFPDLDATVEVAYPPIEETDPASALAALETIHGMGLGDAMTLEVVKQVLKVMGAEDPDAVLSDLTDDDGNLRTPADVAREAVRYFERGDLL